MSFTLVGWASATIAVYVAKADIQVGRELISLVSGIFAVCRQFVKASRRSPNAMLSGRSSLISRNSSACILCMSFTGIGEKASCQCEGSGGQRISRCFWVRQGGLLVGACYACFLFLLILFYLCVA